MLNLEPDQQEVDASNNDVLEVVLALAVLELDVQAVLDANVHLDAAVHLRGDAVAVDPNVLFADHVGHAARDCDADKVAQLDVDAVVRLVLLLDVLEVEVEGLRVLQLPRRGELLVQREELVVVAAVKEHFYRADELDLDARVLEAFAVLGPHRHGALDRLAVHVQRRLFTAVLVKLDIDHGAVIRLVEDNVDVDGGREEVRHGGEANAAAIPRCVFGMRLYARVSLLLWLLLLRLRLRLLLSRPVLVVVDMPYMSRCSGPDSVEGVQRRKSKAQ